MPAAIIPFIPLIAAGVGSATEIGLTLSGAGTGSPQKDAEAQLLKQQQQQSAADQQAKQKAILASLANSQEQTGGNVGNQGLVSLASIIAGLPGEATGTAGTNALSQFLGTPSSSIGTGTGTSTGTNLVNATFGLNGSQG